MKTIKDWEAKRAGGRITIRGRDEGGHEIRVVGVDRIVGGSLSSPRPIATDKDGTPYALA